jgi:hypothetical protein
MSDQHNGTRIGWHQRNQGVYEPFHVTSGVLVSAERVRDAVDHQHLDLVLFDACLHLAVCRGQRIAGARGSLPQNAVMADKVDYI